MQPSFLAIVASKMNKVKLSFPLAPRGFLWVLQISMRSGTQEHAADEFIRCFGSLLINRVFARQITLNAFEFAQCYKDFEKSAFLR